jgi:hypothetical protein
MIGVFAFQTGRPSPLLPCSSTVKPPSMPPTTDRCGDVAGRASDWISRHSTLRRHFVRGSITTLAPLPSSPPARARANLAGTFWTNASKREQVGIIGGNFTFRSGDTASAGVAIYHASTSTLTPLVGQAIDGAVDGTRLFMGLEFMVPGTDIANIAIYDLVHSTWASSGVPTLQPASGASVVVMSIRAWTAKAKAVIVAGSYAQACLLGCQAICSWDVVEKQWNVLGSGIRGDVTSVAYAGVKLWHQAFSWAYRRMRGGAASQRRRGSSMCSSYIEYLDM